MTGRPIASMTINHSTLLLRLRRTESVMVDQREKAISPFNVMSYRRNCAWRTEKRAGIDSAATPNLYVEKAPGHSVHRNIRS